jgi:hypothetical protein
MGQRQNNRLTLEMSVEWAQSSKFNMPIERDFLAFARLIGRITKACPTELSA